jgi:hypothetical protein
MGWHRHNNRRDANHTAIANALRAVGLGVADTSDAKNGIPDVFVAGQAGGDPEAPWQVVPVEIKTSGGRLTVAEARWHAQWPGPLLIARCARDVLAWFGYPASVIDHAEALEEAEMRRRGRGRGAA